MRIACATARFEVPSAGLIGPRTRHPALNGYLFLNAGGRFSTKAAMPSF
jgi:hypothetical protein